MPSSMGQPEDFTEATLARFGIMHASYMIIWLWLWLYDFYILKPVLWSDFWNPSVMENHKPALVDKCMCRILVMDKYMFVNTIRKSQPQQLVHMHVKRCMTWCVYIGIQCCTTFSGTNHANNTFSVLFRAASPWFSLSFVFYIYIAEKLLTILRSSIAAMVTGRENIGLVVKRLVAMKIPKATWNKRSYICIYMHIYKQYIRSDVYIYKMLDYIYTQIINS